MTKEDLLARLRQLHNHHDVEVAHETADYLLLEYINCAEIEEAYEGICRVYH